MKGKKIILFLYLTLYIIGITGCMEIYEEDAKDVKKAVKVTEIEEKLIAGELEYIGVVEPEQIKKLSFKSSGKIHSIKVQEGQEIKKGDTIALLDTKELNFAVEAAKAAVAGAEAQYTKAVKGAEKEDLDLAISNVAKAEKAYEFAKDSYEKAKKLYDREGISEQDLDAAELEMTIREQEYISAKTILRQTEKGASEEDKLALKSQLDQAKVDLEYKESALEDAVLKSDMDGYVMEILSEEGEITSAGYPVVVLGSARSVVKFGLTQEDMEKVSIGEKIRIKYDEKEYEGTINTIAKIKDENTQTYNAEAFFNNAQLSSGAVVKVYIPTGEYYSIMIPIHTILRGDYDYVYVYKDGKAEKRKITLNRVKGDLVEISGLHKGEKLIIEGYKNIKHGDSVEIVQ